MGSTAGPASGHARRGALVVAAGVAALSCARLLGIDERLPEDLDGGAIVDAAVEIDAPDAAKVDVDAPDGESGTDRDASFDCGARGGGLYEGHCYFTLAPAPVEAAISACEAEGAHLATLTSQGENAFVISRWSQEMWIGLRAVPASNDRARFAWITGELVSFIGWEILNPNENTGCVIVRPDYLWVDRPCSDAYAPLCEVD